MLKIVSGNQIIKVTRLLNLVQQRSGSHWVPDYKPGPYPKTEEERLAAAKKYNLLPEEYEPYPDDGDGAGDYPNFPIESTDAKDPYYAYDEPLLRRNYMEPVHRDSIHYIPEFLTTKKPPYDYKLGLLHCLSAVALFLVPLWYFGKTYPINFILLEKQMPHRGDTHYLFAVDHDKTK